MRDRVTSLFHAVVERLRPARRVQPEVRLSPEQLREALREILADPATLRFLVASFVEMLPVRGGDPCVNAGDVNAGTFGSTAAVLRATTAFRRTSASSMARFLSPRMRRPRATPSWCSKQ